MDESFSVSASKFPPGEPADDWTVEEVLRWSLDKYQSTAVERTARCVANLKERCERECDDVMTLHELAVEMAAKNNAAGGDAENADPQLGNGADDAEEGKPATGPTKSAAANNSAAPFPGTRPPTSALEVRMIVGPHAESKYLLRPRPGAPCLLGRSKGKKFVKNGVSLHKDQEVSTTHGKFVVEGGGMGGAAEENRPKFYFVDVGSTNGTEYRGEKLEPNDRLLLEDGMELKVGNSVLKVVLG